MADISKISINGTVYDIKDTVARTSGGGTWGNITGTLSNQTDLQSALDGKVSKSGDTMTGDLQLVTPNHIVHQSPSYSQDETPSGDLYVFDTALEIHDADGNLIGYIQHDVQHNQWYSGMGISISASRSVNGSMVYNGIGLVISSTGDKGVILESEPWRNALTWVNAGNVTGGTNTVTIPATANEVMAVVQAGTNAAVFSNSIPKDRLSSIWFIGGYYSSSSDYAIVNLNVSNSNRTFQLRTVKYGNGADLKSTSKLTVYYK